jgi:hypothetical protein
VPDKSRIYLRDSFKLAPKELPMLDLTVDVYNISLGHNEDLLKACEPLHAYSRFVHELKGFMKTFPVDEAINKAIDVCIQSNLLADYFKKHRSEVSPMVIDQLDNEMLREKLAESNKRIAVVEEVATSAQKETSDAKKKIAVVEEDKEAAFALLRQQTSMDDDQIAEAIKAIKAKKQI